MKSSKKKTKREKKEHGRFYHIKRRYGLSKEDWWKIWNSQGGTCYICLRQMKIGGRTKGIRASVDHCHNTGKIRLIICSHCNQDVLPFFENNIRKLDRIKKYLKTDWDNGIVPDTTRAKDKQTLSLLFGKKR